VGHDDAAACIGAGSMIERASNLATTRAAAAAINSKSFSVSMQFMDGMKHGLAVPVGTMFVRSGIDTNNQSH
jgi:hypothetical protein